MKSPKFFSRISHLCRQFIVPGRTWLLRATFGWPALFGAHLEAAVDGVPLDQPAIQPIEARMPAREAPSLAPWQQKLTLGPGDVLSVGLYGQADSTVADLFVGPDGRISYLEAQDVMAADLTIDELRTELEKVLSKSHLAPKVVIYPQAYKSKKYYLLGNVALRGVYTLDRPTTVVEAIARAKGFVVGGESRTIRPLVNFGRSFLVRRNPGGLEKVSIDFEALFENGELARNIQLAPDDYLYFPSLENQDIYVLGEVTTPGAMAFYKGVTALQAIAKRGGFTENAYRQNILAVRGSLNHPETFVINGSRILSARESEKELKPGDIIFVARKPWYKAEELLDLAIRSFVDAAVITWTGQNVGPLIK